MTSLRYGHGDRRFNQRDWKALTAVERFWIRVERPEDTSACWIWRGARGRKQYGLCSEVVTDSGTRQPHRVSYELLIGQIPDGMHLDHLCRTPLCVNPSHLEPVTPLENTQRGLHGELKTHCVNSHELTDDNVRVRNRDNARICRTCDRLRMRRARVSARTDHSVVGAR